MARRFREGHPCLHRCLEYVRFRWRRKGLRHIVDVYRRTASMCLPIVLRWMFEESSSFTRLLVCTFFAFAAMIAYEQADPFITLSLGVLSRVSLVQVRFVLLV